MIRAITLCVLLLCLGQIDCVLNPKVVCYYEDWFVWRNGNGKMTVDDVDSTLCTHIVYAYLGVSTSGEIVLPDPGLMVDQHDLTKFSATKGKSKALAAIGGYSLSANFATLVADATARAAFVRNTIAFLKQYNFDGITIDWSNVVWTSDTFGGFSKLLEAFHNDFASTYTLGITVGSHPEGFHAEQINKFVDFISVQTYDYHGSWELVVGHEAPLDLQLKTLYDWEGAGADASKLLMTIPLFAHTWILANASDTKVGAKASGPGKQGPWTQADGKLSYNEVCTQMLSEQGDWEVHNEPELAVIYAINKRTNTWVTFESSNTVQSKTDKATSTGYGGVVAQALENDDFRGLCGSKYPLLKGINAGLNTKDVTRPPATTYRPTLVTVDPNQVCQKSETIKDPKDPCHTYHECTEFMPGIITDKVQHCADGEAFEQTTPTTGRCVDKSLVAGCH